MGTYTYSDAAANTSHEYLLPSVLEILATQPGRRIFEVGCGNGAIAKALESTGFEVTGVDPSESGIAHAAHPRLRLGSAYDDLAAQYGRFPVVLSLEVVEHCVQPRDYAKTVYELLEPGGLALVSTPFHGYWKNLALAVSGRMDDHFTALWDGGHIKFWSERTLRQLLSEAGFAPIEFRRVGRVSALAKSMIAIARKA
jgi:2-polyprenyl-6-hydroxyphenyl methylase/3-demethylubiquinone-9 3-methyltransferase